MSVRTGDPAPPFALPAAPGEVVDVGEAIGGRPVVLLFFPLAFSSVCTSEMCAIRDDWERWADLDAAIYAISVDSPFVTRRFREELGLPFPVLSDFNKAVSRRYGALYEEYFGLEGVSKRSAFVVAPDGTVSYDWVSEADDVEPDYGAIRAAVEASKGE